MLVQKASASHFTSLHFKLIQAKQNILVLLGGGKNLKLLQEYLVVLARAEEQIPFLLKEIPVLKQCFPFHLSRRDL